MSETDENCGVLLIILIENESGKHFVRMDRDDITCYLDEKEILLQAGLKAKILKVEKQQN